MRESLRDLAVDQVKARRRALLTRDGLVLAAVGDIDAAELARQLDRAFGGLPAGAALPSLPDWTPPTRARTVSIERPVPQSSMLIALPGLLREDPDWYAALVMAHVLGGGQQSRLFNEVREKRGLAYSISAGLRDQQKAGLLVVSTGSANEHVAQSLEVIRAELARLRDGVDRPGAGRRQDLPERFPGAVARFLQRDRQSRAPDAGRPPAARLSRPARGADRRRERRGCAARRPSPAARGGDDHHCRRPAGRGSASRPCRSFPKAEVVK